MSFKAIQDGLSCCDYRKSRIRRRGFFVNGWCQCEKITSQQVLQPELPELQELLHLWLLSWLSCGVCGVS